MPPKSLSPSAASRGPIVTRRINGTGAPTTPGGTPTGAGGLKPKISVRQTVESMVSTGSQAEYFKPNQTIIIFDWDDTLCPSSWIRANRQDLSFFRPAPQIEKYQRPLRELQRLGEAVLKLAMKLGSVIIVTNAVDPWVETSCRNFLPALLPFIQQLPVVYARSIYETHCVEAARQPPAQQRNTASGFRSNSPQQRVAALPGMYSANGQNRLANYNQQLSTQRFDEMAPRRWKEVAFKQEIDGFYSQYAHQSWKNVISVGDAIFERDAARRVVLNRPNKQKKCRTKTLKMLDDPEADELISQVKVVQDVLGLMVQYDGDLDIEIDEEDLKLDVSLADKLM